MNWLHNLTFSQAALAPALVLISVPILLHFFARARARPVLFPSVVFLQKILRESTRIKRPREWLILILRTLFFALLILTFLQPVYYGQVKFADYSREKHVIILLDSSASMGVTDGPQSRFAMACGQASEILSALNAHDKAGIIWIRANSRSELPQLSSNLSSLQEGLRRASVSQESADVQGALSLAAEMLKDSKTECEVHIISDFQKTQWMGIPLSFPEKIRRTFIPIGTRAVGNQTVTRIFAQPSRPLAGEEVTIHCELENFSPESVLKTIHLHSDDIHLKQDVRLTPWGKSPQVFKCKFATPGEHPITVSAGEDAFPADNERWLSLTVRESLNVGIAGDDPLHALYWKRALSSVGWARIESIGSARLEEALDFDIILLSGWKETLTSSLKALLDQGNAVVWYPEVGVLLQTWSQLSGIPVDSNVKQDSILWNKSDKPFRLKTPVPNHPFFSIFSNGAHGDPTRGAIFARFEIPPLLKNQEVILSYQDDVPALARLDSKSKFYLWNIPLHREFSSWASQSEFLPFFCEFLLSQRGATTADLKRDCPPGQLLSLKREGGVTEADISLSAEEKPIAIKKQSLQDGVLYQTLTPPLSGIYAWKSRDRVLEYQTINFPHIESDLRTLSPTELKSTQGIALTSAEQINRSREGRPLWPILLGISLVLILFEITALLTFKRA